MKHWDPVCKGVFATVITKKKTPEEMEAHMKSRRELLKRWEEDAKKRSHCG